MELAKIRNKAKQEEGSTAAVSLPVSSPAADEPAVPPALALPDDLLDGAGGEVSFPGPASPVTSPSSVRFDPLAVIMAGRQADQLAIAPSDSSDQPLALAAGDEQYQEFLCFLLGSEEYGVNIMEIKELIKPRELTEVPRAPDFVDGIISLRGMIVPVIDLRKRLGLYSRRPTNQERVVIVRHRSSFCGLRVDTVTGVVRIFDHRREATPAALEGIDRDFVAGIGRCDGRMVILLHVQNVADVGLAGED